MAVKKGKAVDATAGMVKTTEIMTITPPNFKTVSINIEGVAPFVQLRFSEKTKNMMMDKWTSESGASRKGGKKEPKNVEAEYLGAMYETENGERGIPASSFRNAAISACRIAGFKMTLAKLSIFVEADGFDKHDGTSLVQIKGKPESCIHAVRNATGVVDLRVRAMWKKWTSTIRVRYDADQFGKQDVVNLFLRVGMRVGVGEGRPDGKQSAGMGWGLFKVVNATEIK